MNTVTPQVPVSADELRARFDALIALRNTLNKANRKLFTAELGADRAGRENDVLDIRAVRQDLDDQRERLRRKRLTLPGAAGRIRAASDQINEATDSLGAEIARLDGLTQAVDAATKMVRIATSIVRLV